MEFKLDTVQTVPYSTFNLTISTKSPLSFSLSHTDECDWVCWVQRCVYVPSWFSVSLWSWPLCGSCSSAFDAAVNLRFTSATWSSTTACWCCPCPLKYMPTRSTGSRSDVLLPAGEPALCQHLRQHHAERVHRGRPIHRSAVSIRCTPFAISTQSNGCVPNLMDVGLWMQHPHLQTSRWWTKEHNILLLPGLLQFNLAEKLDSGIYGNSVLQQRLGDGVLFHARDANPTQTKEALPWRFQTAQQQKHEDRSQQPGGLPHMFHSLPYSSAHILPCQDRQLATKHHRSSTLLCSHKHMH